MKKIKKIHFVGIKGVGIAPLAIIAKEAGIEVTGSDIDEDFITDESLKKAGINYFKGFSKENINDCDLVITTGAHNGFKNIEVLSAKEKDIPVWSQGEAVGEFMNGEVLRRQFEGISVAGSHGKTTTTGMIATILADAKRDPSYIIGTSSISSLPNSGHLGKGKFFIAEADEYATEPVADRRAKFLWQKPQIAVFTNIELDHPDLYSDQKSFEAAFIKFIENIKPNGLLISSGDDQGNKEVLKNYTGRKLTYGFSPNNEYYISNINVSLPKTFFWIKANGTNIGQFSINVPGEHNIMNAAAAIATCIECGLSIAEVMKGLSEFKGSKRRLEYIGKTRNGADIYDDYAHHPTEIAKTLKTFKTIFPKKKILVIFQSHTYSRTKALFDGFCDSLLLADEILLLDIYPSLREPIDPSISAKDIVEKINRNQKKATLLPKLNDVVEYIDQNPPGSECVVLTMGAGDVYKIGEKIKNEN